MAIKRLDHVNIVTARLSDMVTWYQEMLGLTSGPRPDFPFPGAWLYAGDSAVVHLVGHEGTPGVGSEVKLKLEHFALTATGLEDFQQKLDAWQYPYRLTDVPGTGVVQVHLADPDGNHIHIDFEQTAS